MDCTNIARCQIDEADIELIKAEIRKIPDFPIKGVLFYDLFSLLKDVTLHQKLFLLCENFIKNFVLETNCQITAIVGLESRGFLIGLVLADRLKLPFVPIRKKIKEKSKLPGDTFSVDYITEYSEDHFEIQSGILEENSKVLIVDDLLATGGSLKAGEELISKCNAELVGYFTIFEIGVLRGRDKLSKPNNVISMITI